MGIEGCWINRNSRYLGYILKDSQVIPFNQTCLHSYYTLRNASPDYSYVSMYVLTEALRGCDTTRPSPKY